MRRLRSFASGWVFKGVVAIVCALAYVLASCNLANEEEHAFLEVTYDSTWANYDTVIIAWKDTALGAEGTFFRGTPAALKANNKLPADGYKGQKLIITIRGIKDGAIAFEEERRFDGHDPDGVIKTVTKPFDVTVKPDTAKPVVIDTAKPVVIDTAKPVVIDTTKPVVIDTAKPIPKDTVKPGKPSISILAIPDSISIGDSIAFTARVVVEPGILSSYAWDFEGDGVVDDSGNLTTSSATVTGGHLYGLPGHYPASLLVRTKADSTNNTVVTVHVVQDEPIASAGRDTTVYLESQVHLHGTAKDALGRIYKTEWKLGPGGFVAGSGATSFQAPAAEVDIVCIFRVTDDDGLSDLDTVLVHVISKSESNLTSILASQGVLTPQFNPAVLAYTDTVPYASASVTLTATGEGTLRINGTAAVSGEPSGPLDLPVGKTAVNLTVRRDGSAEKIYRVELVRLAISSSANLASLAISAGALDTAFTPQDTSYLVKVGNGTDSTTVTATISGPYTSLKLNGADLASGTASAGVKLAVGENLLRLEVLAQSGNKKTYLVRVVRAPNANANLSGITCSLGAYAPVFFTATYEYSLEVENEDSIAAVGATTAVATSALTINGLPAASGVAVNLALKSGVNRISIVSTAQNGAKTPYTLQITRAKNGNADLSDIGLSAGNLSPAFSPDLGAYKASVGNEIDSITVKPFNAVSTSTVAVNDNPVASGSASGQIGLISGDNAITIAVTAENGGQRTYTVVVTRGQSSNAVLASLELTGYALAPAFHKDSLSYFVQVGNGIPSVSILAAVANPAATYSASPPSPVALKVGSNTITVAVTAEDKSKRFYMIQVTRSKNGNDTLLSLGSTAGPLTPAFDKSILNYSATVVNTVPSVTFTPSVEVSTSSVAVNGSALASGSTSLPFSLKDGPNPVPIAVTAEDGSVRTYTVTVTRELTADASLTSMTAASFTAGGASAPMYPHTPVVSGTSDYFAAPANVATRVRVKLGATHALSTLLVNGKPVAQGQESQDIPLLTTGPTLVPIIVTAPDGQTKKYYSLKICLSKDAGVVTAGWTYLWRTYDGGDSWVKGTVAPGSFSLDYVHFFDVNVGIGTGYGGSIYKTTDAGQTWIVKATSDSYRMENLQFINATTGFAFGYRDILKTTDAGETWKSVLATSGNIHFGMMLDDKHGIAGAIPGKFYRTSDGGEAWVYGDGPNPGTVEEMDFLTPKFGILAMTWWTSLRTKDGGATFDTIATYTKETRHSAAKILDENTYLLGGEGKTLLKTKDGGKTWVEKLGGGGGYIESFYFKNATTGWAGLTGNFIYRTDDAGETWSPIAIPNGGSFYQFFFFK